MEVPSPVHPRGHSTTGLPGRQCAGSQSRPGATGQQRALLQALPDGRLYSPQQHRADGHLGWQSPPATGAHGARACVRADLYHKIRHAASALRKIYIRFFCGSVQCLEWSNKWHPCCTDFSGGHYEFCHHCVVDGEVRTPVDGIVSQKYNRWDRTAVRWYIELTYVFRHYIITIVTRDDKRDIHFTNCYLQMWSCHYRNYDDKLVS